MFYDGTVKNEKKRETEGKIMTMIDDIKRKGCKRLRNRQE